MPSSLCQSRIQDNPGGVEGSGLRDALDSRGGAESIRAPSSSAPFMEVQERKGRIDAT